MGKAHLVGLLTGLLWVALASAHPNHSSYAELDWSDDATQLEVSLKVVPEDLERALSERSGTPFVLGQGSEGASALLESYLRERFRVHRASTGPGALNLLGLDVGHSETWIYFTVDANPAKDWVLENRLLLEIHESQSNRVRCLWTPPGTALLYNRQTTSAPLPALNSP